MARRKAHPDVQLGGVTVNEQSRLQELDDLNSAIVKWANRHRLWQDSGFHIPFEYHDEMPRRGSVLYMFYEGPLFDVINHTHKRTDEYCAQLRALLRERGYDYEPYDHVSSAIFPRDEQRKDDFLAIHRWQWIQRLASALEQRDSRWSHYYSCR
jgi:hypothetical protein